MKRESRPVLERFLEKIDRPPHGQPGCWQWTSTKCFGYGRFCVRRGVNVRAHRYAYELFVGPIPDGLTLDHLCRNRACVNPEHLEPVTNAENLRRSPLIGRTRPRQTHCKHGHEFTPENTLMYRGWRHCRTCKRNRVRASRSRA